uniref:FAD dependent oxidoreductase domain-containing protein n=1 Tax=Glossina brevipalpis TaxID=37001 RepID=A0A1A9X595_9MUSC
MRVCVLGGGINGLSCAVSILEYFKDKLNNVEVIVISEKFTPNTTGDGSAGLWGPYLLGDTSAAKVHQWSKDTHDFLEKLWISEDAEEAGVCLIPVTRVATTDTPIADFWKDIVYGFQHLTQTQLNELNRYREKEFKSGIQFMTFTSEPRLLLPYLMKRFQRQGGRILEQKIENIYNFIKVTDYDVVINCVGLGALKLLNDTNMYPIRGQVSRIKAPWLYSVLLDESDDGNYIIPNSTTVVLGGTHQENNFNTSVCSKDKKFILDGCKHIIPALNDAQHLYDWVGLRPGRTSVRLELEQCGEKLLIHNYGHGGSGVTLAWGCAQEVLNILENALNNYKLRSKL